jgi:hypothetical protein
MKHLKYAQHSWTAKAALRKNFNTRRSGIVKTPKTLVKESIRLSNRVLSVLSVPRICVYGKFSDSALLHLAFLPREVSAT